MNSSFPTEASKLWNKIIDETSVASSSRPTPVKRESSNGDLRKMLAAAKARSPKKNGFRPKPMKATRPKTAAETLAESKTLVKYKKSSSVRLRTSSSPEPLPSSSRVPSMSKKSVNVARPTTSTEIIASSIDITKIKYKNNSSVYHRTSSSPEPLPSSSVAPTMSKKKHTNATRPETSTEILARSTALAKMKFKTSSSVHHRLSSSPEPPALSSSPGTSPVRRTPSPPVMPRAEPVAKDPHDGLRLCSTKTCTRVFKYIGFRTCDKCRAKSKRKNDRRKERDNAMRERLARIKLSWDARPKEERFEGYMRQLRNNGILSPRDANVSSLKRKAGLEDELEGKSPLKKSKTDEYQNAEELYAAVRRHISSGSKAPRFRGCFCVVGSAPAVEEARVRTEARSLWKSAGVVTRPEELFVSHILRTGGPGSSRVRIVYQCPCTPKCEGSISVGVESVEGKFTVGDTVTVDITH